MEEKSYRLWDTIIKATGFVLTATSIYISAAQFRLQQRETVNLEFKRNFWQKQSQLYSEVCNNVGLMAASIHQPPVFEKHKQAFLSQYYGVSVLVTDHAVDSAMRELKSYIDILEPKDPTMVNTFKAKVVSLAEICKKAVGGYDADGLR